MHQHHYYGPQPPLELTPPPLRLTPPTETEARPAPSHTVLRLEGEPFGAWENSGNLRRRHSKWPLVAFSCTILLLISLAVLLHSLPGGEDLLARPQASGPVISLPNDTDTPRAEITVPRAPLGDGTTLNLVSQSEREDLSFQEIYQKNQSSIVSIQALSANSVGLGTGIIMSPNGYIITNAHVIEGCSQVIVLLEDDTELTALLVGYDYDTDLAVLKVESTSLPQAEFGNSDTLQVGDVALAIGNPLGDRFRGTMTDGIISAINRDVVVDGVSRALIQTTAALNSGNSGGALINSLGQVVGVTSMKMTSSYDTIEGLGFAIPTTTVKSVVDALIAEGHISGRPTIGITVITLSPADAESLGAPQGVQVKAVEEKSDAYRKGLRVGDIIVAANGEIVATSAGLNNIKSDLSAGDVLSLSVCRNKKFITIDVELVEKYTLD